MSSPAAVPFRKRRIVDDEDYDDDASDAYSSSSASFQSPESSPNEDEEFFLEEDDKAPGPQKLDTKFASAIKKNTQESEHHSSNASLLATQPFGKTPSPKMTKARTKKRKVSLSPRDSLARSHPNNDDNVTKRRTSPRSQTSPPRAVVVTATKSKRQKEEIIEIQDDDDDADEKERCNGRNTGKDLMEKSPPPSRGGKAIEKCKKHKDLMDRNAKLSDPLLQEEAVEQKGISGAASSKVECLETPTKTEVGAKAKMVSKSKTASDNEKTGPTTDETKATPKDNKTSSNNKKVQPSKTKKKENKEASAKATSTTTKKKNKVNKQEPDAAESSSGPPPKKKVKKATATTPAKSKSAAITDSTKKVTAPTSTDTKPTSAVGASTVTKTKKKKKKRTFQDELLLEMFMSCKPYAIKNLAQVLKTNESSVNFCLLALLDKGWILKKEFTSKGGRSKVLYWANQESKNKELLTALQMPSADDISTSQEELKQLHEEDKRLSHLTAQITSGPSNEELVGLLQSAEATVAELERNRQAILTRIEQAKKKAANQPSSMPIGGRKQPPANKKKNITPLYLKKRINTMRDEWRKRKNKCMDFVENLADGMEKKVKDICTKVLDIDTDESEGVKMPPKHILDSKEKGAR